MYLRDAAAKAAGAGEAADSAPLKSDMALTLFQMADHDASSSLSLVEFEDLIHTVWTSTRVFKSIIRSSPTSENGGALT